MIKTLLLWTAAFCVASASSAATTATDLRVERIPMGSGLQNLTGAENAERVGTLGVWHVPQYMPGYPTAATIWPRVVILQCENELCAGYAITPEMGRGEYLFFEPAVRK